MDVDGLAAPTQPRWPQLEETLPSNSSFGCEAALCCLLTTVCPTKLLGKTFLTLYTVLCDGEKFLRAQLSMRAYRRRNIVLWDCPPKSPDMNPIELFWGWLRKKLMRIDMSDLAKKRAPLGKTAYIARIKTVMRSAKAQQVAKSFANRLRSACKEIVQRKGAAADS